MIRNIFVITILFFLFSSCGYKPIFSMKDVNFNISDIEFSGDKDVERKMDSSLAVYRNKADKKIKIILIIANSKDINIASKNSKGEAQTNRISINTNVKIIRESDQNIFFEKKIYKSSTYAVNNRKSEQRTTENKLTEDLSSEIAKEIIFEILEKTK